MEEPRHTGGCLCGAVRYELSGALSNLCYCHCHSCRRATGAPMVAWGTVTRGKLRITRGTLTEYRSSPQVLRGLCAACGTCITYGNEARAGEIDVTLGSLDEPARLAPRMHVWVADKLPWVKIADGLPQFEGSAGSAGPP
jgi:hypothetical protein